MMASDSAAGLLVTRLWKAYPLSSGLLSPLSESIRAELSLCWPPHRTDGGPPPAERTERTLPVICLSTGGSQNEV